MPVCVCVNLIHDLRKKKKEKFVPEEHAETEFNSFSFFNSRNDVSRRIVVGVRIFDFQDR